MKENRELFFRDLDRIDLKLLKVLQKDAKLTAKKIEALYIYLLNLFIKD